MQSGLSAGQGLAGGRLGSLEVPVFAAIAYPLMSPQRWFAWSSTPGTCCRIETSSLAVFGWMTLVDGDGLAGTSWSAALYVPAMSVGWTRTPLLAIVAYTLAICTALTEMPCP